jgi:hypothetical protein
MWSVEQKQERRKRNRAFIACINEELNMINEHDIKDMWPDYVSFGQVDPTGRSPHEPGAKLDAGKSPVYQGLLDYFPRACLAVAEVSAAGAAKYAWKGWETVPDGINRYSNALGRHIINKAIEGKYDPEGFLHSAQIAWNALATLELELREGK